MDKLEMKSENIAQGNIEKIRQLFPDAVTEVDKDGKTELAIDFDVLKQELSESLVDEGKERYQMTWPGKRQSVVLANTSTTDTLRPCKEESVDFDNTQNLYIEGDNLNVLKLLRETYLGKIKMIYIDPPYNTGNDFIYNDDFAMESGDWRTESGDFDEQGNRLVKNLESNGRFHTDWLNMLYPRLRLARDLLTDDGVIFISIDDNEQANLKKICDEIFGESNFVAELPTITNLKGNNDEFGFAGTHEYTVVYIKDINIVQDLNGISLTDEDISEYIYEDEKGKYKQGATLMRTGEAGARYKRPKGYYPIYVSNDYKSLSVYKENNDDIAVYPITKNGIEMSWRRSPEFLMQTRDEFIISHSSSGISFYKKQRLSDDIRKGKKAKSLFYKPQYSSGNGTSLLKELFDGRIFDNPKPLQLIYDFIMIGSNSDSIILDFFSGSATTAHAVMQLNAEDGGKRKFIMVQLPEKCDEKSEAYKAGYKNICEIGKERIRRAGTKIVEEQAHLLSAVKSGAFEKGKPFAQFTNSESAKAAQAEIRKTLDIDFRVLKLDSSNMQDVYYNPAAVSQTLLDATIDNIKPDRTPLDLLFQVMLELGVPLSAKIEENAVNGKIYYAVNGNDIIACFDDNIDEEVITAIAKQQPLYAVFKDQSFASDSVAINNEQLFKTYSPATVIKVI